MTAAVLPSAAEVISGTQTNAEQKVDFASMLNFLAENINKGTTGGTTTAYTLTLVPALVSLEAGQRFRVKFNAANTTTGPTLNVNSLGAVALKVYGTTGAKELPAIGAFAADMLSDVEYDGTDYVVLDQLPAAIANGSITPAKLSQPFTAGTAVATTSGTNIDFTGIPSWAKRVTVMLNGVSTNGTSLVVLVLGISSGFETSGYLGSSGQVSNGVSPIVSNFTANILVEGGANAAAIRSGAITLNLIGSNTWAISGVVARSDVAVVQLIGGVKPLAGVLDRIRLTTAGGVDTFDAGSINITYE